MRQELMFEGEEPERLDKFLARVVDTLSRVQIQVLIEAGEVQVAGKPVQKSSLKLENGQQITFMLPAIEQELLEAENLNLDVLFEDQNVVVINKPAGLVVHPGAGHARGTLVQAALYRWPTMREVGDAKRPGVVHRLDKDTSGMLVLAKTQEAYLWLVRQFKSRRTEKHYLALVEGHPPTPTGRIETQIGRDPKHRQRMAVLYQGHGRRAVSEYASIKSYTDYELLDVHLITGRTHQIRVHMAYLGCPVVGDLVYGHRKRSLEMERFFLHAATIKIILPGEEEPREFKASLPEDLASVLEKLDNAE